MKESLLTQPNKELFQAFLTLKSEEEMASFCRDLMTEQEIEEFAARFQMAKMLNEGQTQRDIAQKLNVSVTTVTRVNQWLNRGMNGYKLVLSRLSHHHLHPEGKVHSRKK